MTKSSRTYNTAIDKLYFYLRRHDKRPSRVRNMVLSHLVQLKQPFITKQLINACKQENISPATVYNAIDLFTDAQIIHAVKKQGGRLSAEYELITVPSNKMQMICKKCGRTLNINNETIVERIKAHNYKNFNMQHFTLFVYGECKLCRKRIIKRDANK